MSLLVSGDDANGDADGDDGTVDNVVANRMHPMATKRAASKHLGISRASCCNGECIELILVSEGHNCSISKLSLLPFCCCCIL